MNAQQTEIDEENDSLVNGYTPEQFQAVLDIIDINGQLQRLDRLHQHGIYPDQEVREIKDRLGKALKSLKNNGLDALMELT